MPKLRSCPLQPHGRATLAAAFAVMLCACGPTALSGQVAHKKSYNFSANKSGELELFRADPNVWTGINRFVFTVGFDRYPPQAADATMFDDFSTIPVYPKLRDACRQWGSHTFGDLQLLASELSKGDMRRLLTDLKSAVDRRRTDPVGAERAFNATAGALVRKLGQWEALTASVKRDLHSLSTLTLAADVQRRNTPAFKKPAGGYAYGQELRERDEWYRKNVIGKAAAPQLGAVVSPLAAMNDHWAALASDLAALKTEMDGRLDSRDPSDLAISIEIGLTTWEAVETAAKRFVTDAAAERKYLTGENYYDECPIKDKSYYVIQSNSGVFQQVPEFRGYVISPKNAKDMRQFTDLPPDSITLGAFPLGPAKKVDFTQLDGWMFERQGGGWWRIAYQWSTMTRGPGEIDTHRLLLDVSQGGYGLGRDKTEPKRYFALMSNYTTNISGSQYPPGQYWRCMPTGKPGCYRLYSAFLGASRCLDYGASIISNPKLGTRALGDWVDFGGTMDGETSVWHILPVPTNVP